MKKVTIIVPVYNVASYLNKCLDSILNQTYNNIEIIAIDDGSTDDSYKILKKYQDNNSDKITIIKQTNHGQAYARNIGLNNANGDYIAYVDADDYIDKAMIKSMMKKFDSNDIEIVMCDYYKEFDSKNMEHIPLIQHFNASNKKQYILGMTGPVCRIFRKELLVENKIKFPEGQIFEDIAVIPFVCALSKKSAYINEPFYHYVQRKGSSLNTVVYDKRLEDIYNALDILTQHFVKTKMYNEYKDEIEYIYIEYLLHAANLKFLQYGDENCKKISKIMQNEYPKWMSNKYFKMESFKYKVMCFLLYHNQINLVRFLKKEK